MYGMDKMKRTPPGLAFLLPFYSALRTAIFKSTVFTWRFSVQLQGLQGIVSIRFIAPSSMFLSSSSIRFIRAFRGLAFLPLVHLSHIPSILLSCQKSPLQFRPGAPSDLRDPWLRLSYGRNAGFQPAS